MISSPAANDKTITTARCLSSQRRNIGNFSETNQDRAFFERCSKHLVPKSV
jgi:hypothetical protein